MEPRRKLEKRKSLGDVILLDQERCILCSRCVRFYEDVAGPPQLTVAGLGSRSVISTFMDRALGGNYQGNLADICPVGALTLKKFRFQARVWNLTKQPSTCGECSRGCAITVEVLRKREVKRLRPRYAKDVNGWWMCDTGRFSFPRLNQPDRLAGALRFVGRESSPVEPREALGETAERLAGDATALLLASPWLTVEEGERLRAVAEHFGLEPRFLSPAANDLADDLLHTGDPCPNRRGLEELGFVAIEPEAALEALSGASTALLVGERIGELLGTGALAELSDSLRLVLLDTQALDSPALWLAVGVPNAAERTGTWINVDGHAGKLSVARPAPEGVAPLVRTLEMLAPPVGADLEQGAAR